MLVCMCMEECFQTGHGVLCNGANQIVVRNSQGPLTTAERREDPVGEEGALGATTGALSHDDTVKQNRLGLLDAVHTFVSGHSLPCLAIQQNPLRALETRQQWVISWDDSKVWYESVQESDEDEDN